MANEKEQKMEARNEDIEMLKVLIRRVSPSNMNSYPGWMETTLEVMTSFNGKQILDSCDMRLQLKVCNRPFIRWRNSSKLPYFRLSGKICF